MTIALRQPPTQSGLPYLGLVALSRAIRDRKIGPTEATAAMLERIAAYDPILKSYATVLPERAMARAQEAEAEIARGFWRGPLHGIPIALKDLCYTSFAPTAAGMAIHRSFVPPYDATVVERLELAGAIVLGKLAMTEGAFSGHHPEMLTPVNPWLPEAWTGASSSGSGTATAAGLCYGSLGSDTGGSIRFPSTACGLTGLKPTWGRVSRYGVFPLADSLDHVGPMTRSAEDAAAMMAALAGFDPNDPTTLKAPVPDYLGGLGAGIRGLRIGLPEAYALTDLQPDVERVMGEAIAALQRAGARIVPVTFPTIEAALEAWTPICLVEAAIAHEQTYPSRAAEYGPQLKAVVEGGRKVTALELGKAMQQRLVFNGAVAELFESVDLLVLPAMPVTVPTAATWMALAGDEKGGDFSAYLRFTAPFDLTGSPALTLPGGFDASGVPVGFQLVGPHLSEDVLLKAGHAFQQITDWHTYHPDLDALQSAAAA